MSKPSPTMKHLRAIITDGGLSIRGACKDAGLSSSAMARWMHDDPRTIVQLESLLGALGYELRLFRVSVCEDCGQLPHPNMSCDDAYALRLPPLKRKRKRKPKKG